MPSWLMGTPSSSRSHSGWGSSVCRMIECSTRTMTAERRPAPPRRRALGSVSVQRRHVSRNRLNAEFPV
jgi:hypothetical protein